MKVFLTAGFLVASAFFLCGCSPQQTSLVGNTATASTATTLSTKVYSSCNQGPSASGTFRTTIEASVQSGVIDPNTMFMKITQLPSGFATSGYFQFFRWMVANNSESLDNTPLTFSILDKTNGAVLMSGMTGLSWANVSSVASSISITDPATFFSRVDISINLNDASAAYQVLLTSFYNSNNVSQDSQNLLMPVFDATPAGYATTPTGATRSPTLQALHPFANSSTSGWTAAQFQTAAGALCSGF